VVDRGRFVGDYMGIAATGADVLLLFVRANPGDAVQPTDVVFARVTLPPRPSRE
jgi:hypothetical protein